MDIQIIVDSCCDLTPALRNLLRVSVDVGSIHYVDDERIDTKKLIADMKAYKNAPSTACPSPDEYAALMEKSEESFVVTLSGKLSGSYNAACVGREMVLERGLLSWEEAVYKATLYPAQTFEIPGKGVLEPGYDADLALLNPRTIRDRADFPDRGFPDAPPDGLPYVIVAGEPAVDGGIYRHTRSGRLIRRPI